MRRADDEAVRMQTLKRELGQIIKNIRKQKGEGGISQRKLAEAVMIPPSNMKYIEDGVNAPSPRVYEEIIRYLVPDSTRRGELDRLYSAVRETPPPDVCRIICDNEGMNDVLREISELRLSQPQLDLLRDLIVSFRNDHAESMT